MTRRKKVSKEDSKEENSSEIQEIGVTLFKKSPFATQSKLKEERQTSRGTNIDDNEEGNSGEDNIIQPPYNLQALSSLISLSSELPQNIDAMKQNCEGYGYNLTETISDEDKSKKEDEVKKEKKRVDDFFKYSSYQNSFTKMRKKIRGDLESIGNGYMEILRDNAGELSGFEYIKGVNMRLTSLDKEFVMVDIKVFDSEKLEYKVVKYRRRFRRIVEVINEHKVFFKEFGDPRHINARNGLVISDEDLKTDQELDQEDKSRLIVATEVFHFSLDVTESVYGLPRWIGTTPSIVGSRAMEEVNVDWFHNKAIPPLVYMISGGKLTKGAVERIQQFQNEQIKGTENYHKALVLDAVSSGNAGSLEKNQVKIEIKELKQMSEGIFLKYDERNSKKIRSSFRLPPIFVGATDDYTQATAKESKEVAEEQVFAPERADFDFFINRNIFPELDVRFHAFQTKSVPINNRKDETDITKIQGESGLSWKETRLKLQGINDIEITSVDDDKVYMNLPIDASLELLKTGVISLVDTMEDLEKGILVGVAEEGDEEVEEDTTKKKHLSPITLKSVKELQSFASYLRKNNAVTK